MGLLCLNNFTNCKKTIKDELEIETSNNVTNEPSAIVAKDGTGSCTNVQAAVNAAPDYSTKPFIIYIKSGTYDEKLTVPKSKNTLVFKGESAENTLITFENYSSSNDRQASPSVYIPTSVFTAENITFETSLN